MKITLDGVAYTVTPEQEAKMLAQFQAMGEQMYENQGPELQLLVTALVRWILSKWEGAVRKTQGKEASLLIRPPRLENGKKQEPAIHLTHLLVGQMREVVKHAEITIETDDTHTATAFNLSIPAQNQTGGSLVSHGHERERENHGIKIS